MARGGAVCVLGRLADVGELALEVGAGRQVVDLERADPYCHRRNDLEPAVFRRAALDIESGRPHAQFDGIAADAPPVESQDLELNSRV
jgi:hypothetical protein